MAGPPLPPPAPPPPDWIEEGRASWYGEPFHGRLTASGEVYDMDAMTAAHPSLPFGTVVDVHNLENGRSATVRINDRGPFVGGRIIDLSRRAARELDMIEAGVVRVRLVLVGEPGRNPGTPGRSNSYGEPPASAASIQRTWHTTRATPPAPPRGAASPARGRPSRGSRA